MTMIAPPASIRHQPERSRFHLQVDGHEAELGYHLRDGQPGAGSGGQVVMVIDHTGVPAAIGGRGIAARLVQAAFDHARDAGWQVLPACSYAEVWITRHPQYSDLLAA